MGGMSIWHWLILLVHIGIPAFIGLRSRTLMRAVAWSATIAVAIMAAIVAIAVVSNPVGINWDVNGAIRTVVFFVVISANAYGLKKLLKRPARTI